MKTTACAPTTLLSREASVIFWGTALTAIVCVADAVFETPSVSNSSFGLQYDVGAQFPVSVDEVVFIPRITTSDERTRDTAPHDWGVGRPERTRPFAILNGERKRLKEVLQKGHPETLQCGLQVGDALYLLDLEKNEALLPRSPTVLYYPTDGAGVTEDQSPVTHCFYHGSVQGFPQSRVALSTCYGLRGVIVINSTLSFELEPEEEGGRAREEDAKMQSEGTEEEGWHLLYPPRQLRSEDGNCGVSHQPRPGLDAPLKMHRHKRDILNETKYIELVLVVDHSEWMNYEKNNRTIVYRMLDVSNQVDWFFRPLGVRVALVGVELWSDRDRIPLDGGPAETLDRFLEWRARDLLPRLHHDNAQLVLGTAFDGRTVGMASQSSMCSPERSGGISVDNLVSVLGVASTVAHELGHNLGMLHDLPERRCLCQNPTLQGGCIMEPTTGLLPGQMFSSCSVQDLSVSLLHGGGACLFNVPQPKMLLGGPRCGNLYVEQGEECDCGLRDECKDPCCNAVTCKLVPGAQCSSDGICCDNCKLRSAGLMCREALGECDLAEHCTGTSPQCPPNVFLQDGHTCEGGKAYCYSGVCASLNAQCRDLWGANSTGAPEVCFLTVNKLGNKYGNCGRLPSGAYIPCSDSHVHCGKIQCQGGNVRPQVISTRVQILTTKVRQNQNELICRTSFYELGEDVSDPATVAQGTACGPGKACLERRCRDIAVLGVDECQRKCSSHGVCNSNHNCHCDQGWAPPDCKYSGYGGSVDSGPIMEPRDSDATRAFLVVVSLFVLLGALFFLLLRNPRLRRRLLSLRNILFLKGPSRQQSRTPALERIAARGGDQAQLLRPHSNPRNDIPLTPSSNEAEERPLPPSKPLPPDPVSKSFQSAGERPRPPTKPLPPDPVPPGEKQAPAQARPPPPMRELPADPPSRPPTGVTPSHGAKGSPEVKLSPRNPTPSGSNSAPSRRPPPPPKPTFRTDWSPVPHQRYH